MNEFAIEHIPESKYCFAENKNTITIRLRISKFDIPDKIEIVYGGKYEYAAVRYTKTMQRICEDRLFAYYSATLQLNDVRFVYIFKITEKGNTLFFSEDGLTDYYDYTLNYYNCFQLAYINEVDIMKPIEWMNTACFYQIFVERFCVGNKSKDLSYVNMEWGDLPKPKSFAGGDIKGITGKLSYLKNLGINALYLTPVFSSVSNHKYDISDYYDIDKNFGTKADLKELIEKAHATGMKIVLDAVFNHCSENLSQFQDVIKNGKKSKYHDWFIITNNEPLEYECFASCKYMPKFNTSNPEVCEYLIGKATYWIKEFDIDGWRLDVSDEISHKFWREFRKAVKAVKSDCVLIGENWQTEWDDNKNGIPDMIENWSALYRFSKKIRQDSGGKKYGYMQSLCDSYFSSGYLFSFGGYVFGGEDGTDTHDIGFDKGESYKGAKIIRQLASVMNMECTEFTVSDNRYSRLAEGTYFATMTTPDVYTMFIREMVNKGYTEEYAKENVVMVDVPQVPVSGDLEDESQGFKDMTVMGGVNGYAISSYTSHHNAALEFVNYATSYKMVKKRNELLGISPAIKDIVDEIGGLHKEINDNLNGGSIYVMPSVRATAQIWSPMENFFSLIAGDILEHKNVYNTDDALKNGLKKVSKDAYDAIHTLVGS